MNTEKDFLISDKFVFGHLFRELADCFEAMRAEGDRVAAERAEFEFLCLGDCTPAQMARFAKLKKHTHARITDFDGELRVTAGNKNGIIDAAGVLRMV